VSLAEQLRDTGLEVDVTPGQKSQFDVLADGELLFSKQALGRFPEDGEVAALLAGRDGRD
jgi:hypothetical protein